MLGRIFSTSSKGLCVTLVLSSLIFIWVLAFDNTNTASTKIKNETQPTTSVLNTSKLKKACELFTEEHAVALLGGDLEKDSTFGDQQETEDISLTTCSYSNAASNIRDIKSAPVVVRAAKNDLGRISNKSGFLASKTRVFGHRASSPTARKSLLNFYYFFFFNLSLNAVFPCLAKLIV